MNLSGFKAYDIRGEYPSVVDEDLAYAVGRAFSRHLSASKVVVGMDMRTSSPSLKEKLIEGLSCEGVDVFDIGLCTTPMLASSVIDYGYDGGVMVSASHSPDKDNGLKLIDSQGVQIGEGFGLEEIKKIVEKGFSVCPGRGTVTEKTVLPDYVSKIMKTANGIDNLKVVADYSSGVGSVSGKPVLARMSEIETIELNSEPDGTFPSHPANPHDLENFIELQDKIKEVGADIGLFFDGDADRVQAVDENGDIVPMDLLFCLLAKEELATEKNRGLEYYYDLRFTKAAPDLIKEYGGKPVMMRVGNPFYKKALSGSGVLAAEFSGHVMYAENNNIDDALFCSLKILSMLSRSDKTLSEMVKEINKYETSNEVSLEAKNPKTVYDRVKSEYPEGEEVELDGLYLNFKDGFISVRQSQTETQLFRVRVEAETKKAMQDRLDKVIEIVKS